ncbi:emp24p/erv25p- protein, partial [Nowakowskiella sp. JEL0078]
MAFSFVVIFVLTLLWPASSALHFYLEKNELKCFVEDLPKETTTIGSFKAEEWSSQYAKFMFTDNLSIEFTVEEKESKRQLVKQKGSDEGKFTFTAAESGEHSLCFRLVPKIANGGGWFSAMRTRITLDLMFGEPEHEVSNSKKEVLNDISSQIKETKNRIAGLKKDLEFQKNKEAEWRDASERSNSK